MQVFQRDTRSGSGFGHGAGLVSFTLTLSQPATLLAYQLVNASGGAVLQPWMQAAVGVSSGSQIISMPIPASLNWYLVQFRANSDPTSVVATTNKIAVGEVVAFSGQSLAVDFVSQYITGDTATIAGLGLTINQYGPVFAAYTNAPNGDGNNSPATPVNYPGAWALPADGSVYNGAFAVQFLNQAISKLGVPVALVGLAVGGTTLAQWQPGYTQPTGGPFNNYGNLAAVLTASGGKFGTMLWMQGHGDAKLGSATTAAGIVTALGTLFAALRATYGAGFKLVLSSIPALPSGYAGATFASVQAVRQGYQQYAASQAAYYVDGHDAALFISGGLPGVHPSQAGNITLANHFYRAFMQAITALSHGDAGPLITSASRPYGSTQIGLTISEVNSGTSLSQSGSIATLFQVFPSGTTTSLYNVGTVTIANAGSISLGITPTPTEPASLDVWYLAPFDSTTSNIAGIYDNVTDGDGLTQGRLMSMVPNAITAIAPQVFLTIGAIGSVVYGASIAVTGTYGNGTPTGLKYSFSGGGSWVTATATISGGNYNFVATAPGSGGTYAMLVQDTGSGGNFTSNSFTVTGNTLTVGAISGTTAGSSISVSGTYANGVPAALDYSADGGNSWTAASSPTIGGGSYSLTIGSGLPVGTYGLQVRDHATLSTGTSPAFTVTSAGASTALPTLSASQVPVLHFDAANIAGQLFQDTALSVQAVAGALIAGFKDLSASGSNFTQAISTQRPTYQASIKNGLPGVRFTGAAYQFLSAVSTALAQLLQSSSNFGALVVFTPASLVSSTQIAAEPLTFGLNTSNAVQHCKFSQSRSNGAVYFENNGSGTNNLNVAAGLTANTIFKCVNRWTAGTQALAINSLTEGTLTGVTGSSGATWNFGYIGAGFDAGVTGATTYNATYPFDGWVHEIIIYNAALTTADRSSLLSYATTKWGS